MKSSDDMMNSLMQRREEYVTKRDQNRKKLMKTALPALSLCLVLLAGILIWAPQKSPAGPGDTKAPEGTYPYNDAAVLDYTGKKLDPVCTEDMEMIFNELTDIEAYRRFNLYQESVGNYYQTGTTVYDLFLQAPVKDDKSFLNITLFEKDGKLENCPAYEEFKIFAEKAPLIAEKCRLLLQQNEIQTVSLFYNEELPDSAVLFTRLLPGEYNDSLTLLVSEDISRIDKRFEELLPTLKAVLGTENSSHIDGQEISLCYFYQTRLYQEVTTEEAFRYYAYWEKDGLEMLCQYSSAFTLPDQAVSAMHNSPEMLCTQEEARALFLKLLPLLTAQEEK